VGEELNRLDHRIGPQFFDSPTNSIVMVTRLMPLGSCAKVTT